MTDPNAPLRDLTEENLIRYCLSARTVKEIATFFKVNRLTARRWIEEITATSGYRVVVDSRLDRRSDRTRGPKAKTYRTEPITTPKAAT